jgi:hypothetical protein
MRPNTLAEAVESIQAGSPRDVMLAEFVDTFELARTDGDRYASIEREPKLTGDRRLDALVAQSPNIWQSSAGWGASHTGSAIRRVAWIILGSRRQTLRTPCANTLPTAVQPSLPPATFSPKNGRCGARGARIRQSIRAGRAFRTAQARGWSPPRARSAILPCRVFASPRTSSRCRRRRMIS